MQTLVVLKSCADYDRRKVKAAIRELIATLGGIGRFVKPGDSVLLKPNMLAPAAPERAVTTHPAVMRAVAEIVMDAGGKPFIADSPGAKSFNRVAKLSGIGAIAAELGIECFALDDSAEYRQGEKKIFRILEISRHAMEADVIINLPKLKTHSQMFLTMGVKNMFGCVVGGRKPQWHLKAGIDRVFFARMLVELYGAISPALTILDGICAMEGDGPGKSGRARGVGLLAGSTDAVALDRMMLEILGAKPRALYTNRAAAEMSAGETDVSRIAVKGDPVEKLRIKDFVFPKSEVDMVPVPGILRKFMTNNLTSRPKEDRQKCTLCDECMDICPTDVISKLDDRLEFNYDKCLRCFCCIEVCPEGAMEPYVPLLLKLVS